MWTKRMFWLRFFSIVFSGSFKRWKQLFYDSNHLLFKSRYLNHSPYNDFLLFLSFFRMMLVSTFFFFSLLSLFFRLKVMFSSILFKPWYFFIIFWWWLWHCWGFLVLIFLLINTLTFKAFFSFRVRSKSW